MYIFKNQFPPIPKLNTIRRHCKTDIQSKFITLQDFVDFFSAFTPKLFAQAFQDKNPEEKTLAHKLTILSLNILSIF